VADAVDAASLPVGAVRRLPPSAGISRRRCPVAVFANSFLGTKDLVMWSRPRGHDLDAIVMRSADAHYECLPE